MIAGVVSSRQKTQKIALISSTAFSVINFRGPLISRLLAHGITVYALAPDYDEETRRAVVALGAEPVDISLERAGMRLFRDFGDFIRLVVLLRKLRPDAVLGYFIKPVIYGSLAAALADVPRRFSLVAGLGYVYTPGGGRDTFGRRVLRWIVSFLYQQAFRVCTRVFFQNNEDLAYFVERGLLSPEKALRLNGTGVDLELLQPSPLAKGSITFLLMARLLAEKGIREYVEAARLVKAEHPDCRFVLLGGLDPNPGGLSRSEVEAWVHEGVIEWQGHVDEVRPWISQACVYVLPSYYREGVPRSTQEAMAMGRPVITTDAIGCRETVEDGVNGFLVPVRDSDALAEAMLRFIDNPELIEPMGKESRRLAEEKFDVHKINAEILKGMGIN